MGQRLTSTQVSSLLVGLVVACGGSNTNHTTERPAVETIAVPEAGADHYATEATGEGVTGEGDLAGVRRGIETASGDASMTLVGDGRLAQLAAWLEPHLPGGGGGPPHEVIELFARQVGLVEPVPHLLVVGHSGATPIDRAVADGVRQFLARDRYTHYGAAIVPHGELSVIVIALSRRMLQLEGALPRQAEGELALRGTLAEGYSIPSVAVTRPSGEVERMEAGAGPGFDVPIRVAARGRHQIELLARGPRGDTVVANFPVYVGEAPPREVAIRVRDDEADMADPSAVEAALLARINESREAAGLRPLQREGQLDGIARAHSEDMQANDFVGHRSPTTGDAPERVQAAGVRSGLILENIGRGYSPTEIHQGLMASPGHRANVLHRSVTHVGIGVVEEQEGSRRAFLATEVYVRMNTEIDVADARQTLLDAINRGRTARGAEPLSADENLERAATDAAAAYFENPTQSQQDTVDDASASLRRFSMMFSRIGGLMTVVGDVQEATRLEPTFDPDVRYVGIGVAQGDRPDAPPNSIGVVILLGWPR